MVSAFDNVPLTTACSSRAFFCAASMLSIPSKMPTIACEAEGERPDRVREREPPNLERPRHAPPAPSLLKEGISSLTDGVGGALLLRVVLAWELVGERGMSAAKKKRGAEAKQQLRRK